MMKQYKYGDETQISPHFKASEFQCKCSGKHDFIISEELVEMLERLRADLNCSSIRVSSGYRCSAHDKAVGGKGNGKHTLGLAADVCCFGQDGKPISSKIVSCAAQDLGFHGIANIHAAYTYTHLDMRTGAKWYGNEIYGNSNVTNDFHAYYGIPKEDKDCPYPMPTKAVRENCTGDDVRWVQWHLARKGYMNDAEIDGVFTLRMFCIVCGFQAKSNLRIDGVCGPATRAALAQ